MSWIINCNYGCNKLDLDPIHDPDKCTTTNGNGIFSSTLTPSFLNYRVVFSNTGSRENAPHLDFSFGFLHYFSFK